MRDLVNLAPRSLAWLLVVAGLALACDVLHHLDKEWLLVKDHGLFRVVLSSLTAEILLVLSCALLAALIADFVTSGMLGTRHSLLGFLIIVGLYVVVTILCVFQKKDHSGLSTLAAAYVLALCGLTAAIGRFILFRSHRSNEPAT